MRQNKNPFASSEKEIGQRQTPLDDNSSVDTSEIDAMITRGWRPPSWR